jgi:hypothetical protein
MAGLNAKNGMPYEKKNRNINPADVIPPVWFVSFLLFQKIFRPVPSSWESSRSVRRPVLQHIRMRQS